MLCDMDPMLSETYTGQDIAGWWLSEKFDGVRAIWTGRELLSRNGNRINAPEWFIAQLPAIALDGELWMWRGQFRRCLSCIRRGQTSDLWKDMRYIVFDAPKAAGPFESRISIADDAITGCAVARIANQTQAQNRTHMESICTSLMRDGAEGVMLRQPGSAYDHFRSNAMLKYKGVAKLRLLLECGVAV